MNRNKFWEGYGSIPKNNISLWFEGLSPIEKNKIKDRVRKLSIEIIHGNYYDGWPLEGMKEEKEKLSILLGKNI